MEFLEKGTFVDVSSDIAERLLQEYGAFFEKSGQEIIVSQDNTIKMDDSGRMYFKKPNGSWEEILLTNENEEVEEVEEEKDTDDTGEEDDEEEDVEREGDVRMEDDIGMDDFGDEDIDYDSWQENEQNALGGIYGNIIQRNKKIQQNIYERLYGKCNERAYPNNESEKILTGSNLNNFISHICDYKSGIKIFNGQNIAGLYEFRNKYVNKINNCNLELYWNADSENALEKFNLGTTSGIKKLLDYQYEYSKIPLDQKVNSGKLDLPKASHDGLLRKSRILGTVSHKLSKLNPFKNKTEQVLKYTAYVEIADNLTKILNFTKRDCHTTEGAEFVEKIKNVWIPFLQADQNISKEGRKDNFVNALNLFVKKVEAEQGKQVNDEASFDNEQNFGFNNEPKSVGNKYAQHGLLNADEIFNFK